MRDATIYDIARAAGVSASTVSRVINKKPGIKQATRELVEGYLEQFNYSPNEAARGLVNQASRMVGILISDIRTTHHTDGVYYMEREFSKLGYGCIMFNTGRGEGEKADYIQALSARRVEAAALIGSSFQCEQVEEAIRTYMPGIPVVLANGVLDLPNVYGVVADERGGVESCVRLLWEKGRRNLAFLRNDATPSNRLKQEGFEAGTARFPGLTAHVMETGLEREGAYEATLRLMKERPQTDGIIYSEDLLAVYGLKALRHLGLPVPGRVSVIGINNSTLAQLSVPTLTSLDNMLFDMSVTAVRSVMDALQGNHAAKKVMILSNIVEREST